MTPRLPAVTAKEVVRVALKLGFVLDRQSGSHAMYFRDTDKRRVTVSVHAQKTIKPKTLLGIVRDLGLDVDEFRRML